MVAYIIEKKSMKPETYFKKYGKIYGVAYKYEFDEWKGWIEEFDNMEDAEKWLYEENYDFLTKELGSKRYCEYILKN